jgi:two-component system, chemotaxis family, sensor kinase CheA
MELILDADLEDLQFWMVEADEQLQVLDEDLIRLERESDDEDLLQRIFRAAHTLKGSSGTIKHNRMAHLTHAMEGVLDELRDDKMSVTSDLIDVLLDSLDNLGLLKDEVTTLTVNDDIPVDELVDRLNALREASEAAADDTEAAEEPAADAAPAAKPAFSFDLTEAQQDVIQSATVKGDSVFHINVGIDPESALLAARKLQLLTEAASAGEVLVSVPTMDEVMEESSSTDLDLLLVTKESEAAVHSALSVILDVQDIAIVSFEATEEAAEAEAGAEPAAAANGARAAAPPRPAAKAAAKAAATTVRVDVERLDALMNLVGEMVIDKTRLLQLGRELSARYDSDPSVQALADANSHIGRITDELQEEVMRSRMLPVENVFNRFPRMIRDLTRKAGKKINFVVEGKETELDRSVIEEIGDPLIHLLRNSIDHGIEVPEDRVAAGKSEEGTITLSARHEENHIVIRVADDGKGIDGEKVAAKAVKNGLLTQEAADRLTPAESADLIFAAGLSTAEVVSEVSGRGVGMDIVKTNIEKLNGTVSISTELGKGTEIEVHMPLTLAIIRALLTKVEGRVFSVPLVSVRETLELAGQSIRTVGGREVIMLRGEVLPLLRLNQVFPARNGLPELANGEGAGAEIDDNNRFIVAVRLGDRQVGMIVDELVGEQEVVIKSLGNFIGDVDGIAGATILGDGRVAMIVDVGGVLQQAIKLDGVGAQVEPDGVPAA